MVDGNSWFELAERRRGRLEQHDITYTNRSRPIKTSRAHSENSPESAVEQRQKLNDIKTAVIYEDDESTTCRKPPLRETVSPDGADPPRAQNASLLQAHKWYLLKLNTQ